LIRSWLEDTLLFDSDRNSSELEILDPHIRAGRGFVHLLRDLIDVGEDESLSLLSPVRESPRRGT
jgi:hypothetical protein